MPVTTVAPWPRASRAATATGPRGGAEFLAAGLHRGAGVDRVIHHGHGPAGDLVSCGAGETVAGRRTGFVVGRQEGGTEDLGHHLGQERPTGHGPAHRGGLVLAHEVGQVLGSGPDPGWPEEQGVKLQPQVAVIAGAQVEVSAAGTGELAEVRTHQLMVPRGGRQPRVDEPIASTYG